MSNFLPKNLQRTLTSTAICLFVAACSSGSGPSTSTGGAHGNTGGTGGSGDTGGSGGTGGASPGTGGATGGANATGGHSSDGGSGGATGGKGMTGGSGGTATGGGGGSSSTGGNAPTDAGSDNHDGGSPSDGGARPNKVLLYSFSTLTIDTVPAQLTIFKQKLEGWQFQVDQSKDPAVFTDANLAKYAAVGMINTCFYPFGANQPGTTEAQALQRFVKAGGGLFGTHCADVTFQSANPVHLYNQLLGGRANSDNYTGNHACRRVVTDHATTTGLPDTFTYNGNLDNAAYLAPDTTVLVKCKFGGGTQADTAVSWIRTEGSGRVFFTSFGKVDADLTNATIGNAHIIAGLGWVLGR